MTHAKPWYRPRNIVLLVLAFIGTVIGLTVYRAMTAKPGSAVDYHQKMRELVESYQPEGARGVGGENAYDHLQAAIGVLTAVEEEAMEAAGGLGARPDDWPREVGWPFDYTALYAESGTTGAHAPSEANTLRVMETLRKRGLEGRLAAMAGARRAVRPVADGGRLIEMPLDVMGKTRQLARHGAGRMTLAVRGGDMDAYASAFEETLALARVTAHQPVLIDRLVAIPIRSLAVGRVREDLMAGRLEGAACRRLLDALERQGAFPPLALALEGERTLALDMIQWTHTDDGHGDGRLVLTSMTGLATGIVGDKGAFGVELPETRLVNVLGYFFPSKAQTTVKTNEFYDGLIALSRLSASQRAGAAFDPDAFAAGLARGYVVLKLMAPAMGQVLKSESRWAAEVAGLRTMLALEAYRAEEGRYPDGLEALVPAYVTAVPTDPTTGEPMGYQLVDPAEDEFGRGYLLFAALPTEPSGGAAKADAAETSDHVVNAPPADSTPGR